jgi:hypothetical protein
VILQFGVEQGKTVGRPIAPQSVEEKLVEVLVCK